MSSTYFFLMEYKIYTTAQLVTSAPLNTDIDFEVNNFLLQLSFEYFSQYNLVNLVLMLPFEGQCLSKFQGFTKC
jgi:hypothetical protein